MSPRRKQAPQPQRLLPGHKGFWRQLYHEMTAALADGAFMRFNGYTVPNRTFNYRSLDEFRKLIDWVRTQADLEEGIARHRGRILAGQGGRR